MPSPELGSKSKDIEKPFRKQDGHSERRHSSSSAVMTPIINTVERTIRGEQSRPKHGRSSIAAAASTTPTGTPPPNSELRLSIFRDEDDNYRRLSNPDTRFQQSGSSPVWPLDTSAEGSRVPPSFPNRDYQKFPVMATTTTTPTRIDPAPQDLQSTRQINAAECPIWYQNDVHGADMGENMVFGDAPLRVYPIRLSGRGGPVWFCPEPTCNRHFNARQRGPEPYQRASALREHAIYVHPPKPLPSTSILPFARINRDSEVAIESIRESFTRAESARVSPNPARHIVPRPASIGSIPAESLSFATAPKVPPAGLPSPTSNARQREETDSLLGSDDDDDSSDHAAATNMNFGVPSNVPTSGAYMSPYDTIPNSAPSAHAPPPFFAERLQTPPAKAAPQQESRRRPQTRFGGRACLSCKARKSKCGKERPSCVFCIRRALPCSYPGEGEITSDSYDSPSESTMNVIRERTYTISASGKKSLGIYRQEAGEGEDEDEDEATLLAEIEAMEVPRALPRYYEVHMLIYCYRKKKL